MAFRLMLRQLAKEPLFEEKKNQLGQKMDDFFRLKSQRSLTTFIGTFHLCYDINFKREIFQTAIKKCVELDCTDCFVDLCQDLIRDTKALTVTEKEADCIFAFSCAINGNRLHFIRKLVQKSEFQYWSHNVNIFQLLFDLILEKKAYDLLVSVFQYRYDGQVVFIAVSKCVHSMLTDHSTRPYMALVLDQWFRESDLDLIKVKQIRSEVHRTCTTQQSLFSATTAISSLQEWCVTYSTHYLAFSLAMITKDWPLVGTMVTTQPSLILKVEVIRKLVFMAAEEGAYTTGAELLTRCPLTAENVVGCCSFPAADKLGMACEDRGLLDWACVLQCCDNAYVQGLLRQCHNQVVINHVLFQACKHENWDLARELQPRCTDSPTVLRGLTETVKNGQIELSEQLMSLVDPSQIDANSCCKETLLTLAVTCEPLQVKIDMVYLMISSGLSTFLKDKPLAMLGSRVQFCPTSWPMRSNNLLTVKLMIDCGVYSQYRLNRIRQHVHEQGYFAREGVDPNWKQAYHHIVKVAATPTRLENLARFAVSHRIGCQPGRSQRIDALPLPGPLKDKVRFKDLLSTYKKEAEEQRQEQAAGVH